MLADLRRRAQRLASFVAVARPHKAKIRPANSQVSWSAWEVVGHVLDVLVHEPAPTGWVPDSWSHLFPQGSKSVIGTAWQALPVDTTTRISG